MALDVECDVDGAKAKEKEKEKWDIWRLTRFGLLKLSKHRADASRYTARRQRHRENRNSAP